MSASYTDLNLLLEEAKAHYRLLPKYWRGITFDCKAKCVAHGCIITVHSHTMQSWKYSRRPISQFAPTCPECQKQRYKNTRIQEASVLADRVRATHNSSITLLSTAERRPMRSPASFRCEVCQTEWSATLGNVVRANNPSGCPVCAVRNKDGGYVRRRVRLYGRSFVVQGYEDNAIKWMVEEKGVDPKAIICTTHPGAPVIWYHSPKTEKQRRYFPDFYLPEQNRLIEVKGMWTLLHEFNVNQCKARASIEAGFKHTLLVMDRDGKRIPIPKNWRSMNEQQIRDAVPGVWS